MSRDERVNALHIYGSYKMQRLLLDTVDSSNENILITIMQIVSGLILQ